MSTTDTTTDNGMPALSSTGNACLNYFSVAGALRSESEEHILSRFREAFAEHRLTALRTAFWARDIRGGQGQRRPFRIILKDLAENHTKIVEMNIRLVAEYGRWDDILSILNTPAEGAALREIATALSDSNALAAKWMPRKGEVANKIRRHLKLTPKQYRKLLVERTRVVESLMCARQWGAIKYEHVPSRASSKYGRAFSKHDHPRYLAYLTAVESGEKKMHADAIYPYDIVHAVKSGSAKQADAQWASLPNYLGEEPHLLLPICDTSGSMNARVSASSTVSCIDVCVSLGLYLSERNVGPFRGKFITFSNTPTMQTVVGDTLAQRVDNLSCAKWDMNTNLEAVFTLILQTLRTNPDSPSPEAILVISDMQFDQATNRKSPATQMIRDQYAEAGRTMPKIIFWNVLGSSKSTPIHFTEEGVGLVSGFSPTIMKTILALDGVDPMTLMAETVHSERYTPITV